MKRLFRRRKKIPYINDHTTRFDTDTRAVDSHDTANNELPSPHLYTDFLRLSAAATDDGNPHYPVSTAYTANDDTQIVGPRSPNGKEFAIYDLSWGVVNDTIAALSEDGCSLHPLAHAEVPGDRRLDLSPVGTDLKRYSAFEARYLPDASDGETSTIEETRDDELFSTDFLAFENGPTSPANIVEIIVGTDPASKTFYSGIDLLSEYSHRLRIVFRKNPKLNVLIFPNWDPLTFELFEQFTLNPLSPITWQPCQYVSEKPWDTLSLSTCFLAMELSAELFLRYAMSVFISNCGLESSEPWAKIEGIAPADSPIRRFSNHWVAWNVHLAGGMAYEFTGLQAVALAAAVTDDTRDPRRLHQDHWFSTCGQVFVTGCDHDPVEQERRFEMEQRRELKRIERERDAADYDEDAIMSEIQANTRAADNASLYSWATASE